MILDATGFLHKMHVTLSLDGIAQYQLDLDQPILLNDYIGRTIHIEFLNEMECISCKRKISKTFQQGYCFPCMRSKAACDLCIVKPERCHFHLGTCREPAWGEAHCMQNHIVYLANTSGLKVGITRASNIPGRFIDQGATQALPIFQVTSRYHSGLIEILLAKEMADKTNWRAMLKGSAPDLDLEALAGDVKSRLAAALDALVLRENIELAALLPKVIRIAYPAFAGMTGSIKSLSLDKTPVIEDQLIGIKGQYLIFTGGVMNIRSLAGYKVRLRFLN